MSKHNRIILLFIILALGLFVCMILLRIFYSDEDNYTITTDDGDTFNVSYHNAKCESYVTSPNSKLNWHYGGKISKDDFISIERSESLTIYRIKASFIYNDGDGFEELNSNNIDDKPRVARKVKEILLSDYHVYSSNIGFFLKSQTYSQEANQIIDYIKQEKYDKLSQYGLTENVINDGHTINLLKRDVNHP